uniref:Ig-like domain-containing protein n=1 Tax=Callorhinchus milii TaxID=7868 RepID=A0A4W3GQR0_CALMI
KSYRFPYSTNTHTLFTQHVTVTQNTPNPIEDTDTVTLTCDVKGTVESRLWFKDERTLHSNDRITISQDNATLTIISVTRNDGGTYRCEAKNSLSSQSGSYTLNIAYGPDTPELTITGTHSAELGDSLTLSCSAQSNPEAQYKWIFNGTVLSHTTPQLTIDQISPTDRGSYTCQARNSVTLKEAIQPLEPVLPFCKLKADLYLNSNCLCPYPLIS